MLNVGLSRCRGITVSMISVPLNVATFNDKTSPNNLPSLIKVLKNVISYDISRCYLCRRLSRAISSPVVLIVVGKQGIRQMVDSWWSETKEKVYGYRITSDPFLWSYSFNKNNLTVCFLRKIVIVQFSRY